jgi:hypothetical protein
LEEEALKRKERLAALKRKLGGNSQQEEGGGAEKKTTDENTELPRPVFRYSTLSNQNSIEVWYRYLIYGKNYGIQ